MRSKRSVSASRAVSATASGWSAKRAAIASGVASTWLWLPRRSGSEASSVVCSRMATNASCSSARAARVRVDVARGHARHPEALGQRREAAVQRAVVAVEGALELDPERVAPEGAQQPAHRRLVAHAARRAAAQADEPLGVGLHVGQRDPRLLRDPRRARDARAPPGPRLGRVDPRLRVRAREQPAEVRPAAGVAHEQREVPRGRVGDVVDHGDLGPVDGSQAQLPGPPARTPSSPRPSRGRSARARAWPRSSGRGRQLVRQRSAVEEREGGVAVELDVAHYEHMFAWTQDGITSPRDSRRAGATPRRCRASRRRAGAGGSWCARSPPPRRRPAPVVPLEPEPRLVDGQRADVLDPHRVEPLRERARHRDTRGERAARTGRRSAPRKARASARLPGSVRSRWVSCAQIRPPLVGVESSPATACRRGGRSAETCSVPWRRTTRSIGVPGAVERDAIALEQPVLGPARRAARRRATPPRTRSCSSTQRPPARARVAAHLLHRLAAQPERGAELPADQQRVERGPQPAAVGRDVRWRRRDRRHGGGPRAGRPRPHRGRSRCASARTARSPRPRREAPSFSFTPAASTLTSVPIPAVSPTSPSRPLVTSTVPSERVWRTSAVRASSRTKAIFSVSVGARLVGGRDAGQGVLVAVAPRARDRPHGRRRAAPRRRARARRPRRSRPRRARARPAGRRRSRWRPGRRTRRRASRRRPNGTTARS